MSTKPICEELEKQVEQPKNDLAHQEKRWKS